MKSIQEWENYIVEWRKKKGFKTEYSNVIEKLFLIMTEVSEAGEAYRKMQITDGIPMHDAHYANFCEELADIEICLLDLTGSLNIDLESCITSKMEINETRSFKHGKNF